MDEEQEPWEQLKQQVTDISVSCIYEFVCVNIHVWVRFCDARFWLQVAEIMLTNDKKLAELEEKLRQQVEQYMLNII